MPASEAEAVQLGQTDEAVAKKVVGKARRCAPASRAHRHLMLGGYYWRGCPESG